MDEAGSATSWWGLVAGGGTDTWQRRVHRPFGSIPATGRKLFNTRAEKASDRIDGQGLRRRRATPTSSRRCRSSRPDAVFDAEEQAKYREFKEARRGAADYMAMEGEFARYLEDHYSAAPVEREALTDECEILVVGAGFAGLLLWYKLTPGRLRRRPLLREGRRRRRHLVLEPLPGHRLRRRVLQLPAAAGGDGVLPDDEVRVGLRDLRVLPEDGGEVRLLRPLPVPHRGDPDRVGRGGRALDRATPTGATPCGPGS